MQNNNIQVFHKVQMGSIILTHGDSDGICSGAIVKSAFPDSDVFFAGTLVQGITEAGRDYDFKRSILNALSEDIPPPEIGGLLDSVLCHLAVFHGGTGGGHPFAGDARIPKKHLEAFLYDLDDALGS